MKTNEAIKKACSEPTLLDALSWICIWESERVIKQAKKSLQDADGKGWDTCFRFCLEGVMNEYNKSLEAPCEKCKGFVRSIDHNYCSNCGKVLPVGSY